MKTLNLDVETTPAQVYTWDLRVRGYLRSENIIVPRRVLCVACKWVRDDDIIFVSEWANGRTEMVHRLWDLLDEADAVLHYNGIRFDTPVINTEFAIAGLPPPSPYTEIDLYKSVRARFSFMSNSLKYVTSELDVTRKLENEGMQLWLDVMDGKREAQAKMREYNIGDIKANESLYEYLLPWLPGHPSHAIFEGRDVCPQCGSDDLSSQGYAYTTVSKFQRYRCRNCGKWSRATRRIAGTEKRPI